MIDWIGLIVLIVKFKSRKCAYTVENNIGINISISCDYTKDTDRQTHKWKHQYVRTGFQLESKLTLSKLYFYIFFREKM